MILRVLIFIIALTIVALKNKPIGGGSWSDQYRNSKYGSHKIDGEWVPSTNKCYDENAYVRTVASYVNIPVNNMWN